jgi:hypothetical protein
MSLADALEAAASELPEAADAIRPANGDPERVLEALSAGSAARVVGWLLENRARDAEELVEVWAQSDAGRQVLASLGPDSLGKAGRKVLRRVRHRLRSQGVDVPEEAAAATVARLQPVEEELSGAWVTPLDPAGARMGYLLEANPSGGARLFEVIFDDARGVLGVEVYSAGRKKVRELLRSLERRDRMPALPIAPDALRGLVGRALAGQPAEAKPPRALAEWKTKLSQPRDAAELPGDQVVAALGSAAADDDGQAAVALIQAGRIGPWPPPDEVLSPLVERLKAALDSPVVVSGATRREQLEEILSEAAGEIFAGEAAQTAAHRLRESAYAFWKCEDEAAARTCLAAAIRFEAGELAGDPVPRALLEVLLGPLLASAEEPGEGAPPDAAEDEPLIVKP